MSIIRRHKTENYSVISNNCIRNKSLSAKAKGIFCYIMTLPDDWKLYRTELTNHFSDGKDSIRSGFDELIEAGYIIATQTRDEAGRLSGWEYDIHETPQEDLPIAENPPSDNPPLLNTKRQPTTEETNISVDGDFDISPAEKSSLPPTPKEAAAPLPHKDQTTEKALALSKELISRMSEAMGRKITANPESASFRKLMAKGVKEDEIRAAIEWLATEDRKRDMPFNIQSAASLCKKWDSVQGSMSRLSPAKHKERVVLSKGEIHFVDRPKCGDNYMREAFKEEHRAKYRILTPDQYRSEKSNKQ